MPNNYRLAKVSSLLKKEITLILQNDLENDLIRDHFVNISKIDLSGDLQHCKIYITSTAQEKVRKEIVANLNIAKSSIRHSFCLLYTSPSPRDWTISRMPSSA